MAQIVQSFGGDNAIRLQNEEFVRQMWWGTNWVHIRISLLMAMPQGVGTIFSPTLFIGACQGTTNTYKSSTTTEWVGMRLGQGVANWTYNAGPPAYFSTGNARIAINRIGNTTTTFGSVISVTEYIPIGIRASYQVDILKTTTGYSVGSATPGSIPTVDVNEWAAMYAGNQDISGNFRTVNYATGGLLDSISLYWDFAPVPLEISSILVVKVV